MHPDVIPICPSCGRRSQDQGYGPFWACRPHDGTPGCIANSRPLQFCVRPTHGERLAWEDDGPPIRTTMEPNTLGSVWRAFVRWARDGWNRTLSRFRWE